MELEQQTLGILLRGSWAPRSEGVSSCSGRAGVYGLTMSWVLDEPEASTSVLDWIQAATGSQRSISPSGVGFETLLDCNL